MARSSRRLEPLRWSINDDAHQWFVQLGERLHINTSVLIRMFLLQLKEGDPVALGLLDDFIGLGLETAIVAPKTMKVFVENELIEWLKSFVTPLRHSRYSTRRVWSRHLLTGYVMYLRHHEDVCVKYGCVRLPERVKGAAGHAVFP